MPGPCIAGRDPQMGMDQPPCPLSDPRTEQAVLRHPWSDRKVTDPGAESAICTLTPNHDHSWSAAHNIERVSGNGKGAANIMCGSLCFSSRVAESAYRRLARTCERRDWCHSVRPRAGARGSIGWVALDFRGEGKCGREFAPRIHVSQTDAGKVTGPPRRHHYLLRCGRAYLDARSRRAFLRWGGRRLRRRPA